MLKLCRNLPRIGAGFLGLALVSMFSMPAHAESLRRGGTTSSTVSTLAGVPVGANPADVTPGDPPSVQEFSVAGSGNVNFAGSDFRLHRGRINLQHWANLRVHGGYRKRHRRSRTSISRYRFAAVELCRHSDLSQRKQPRKPQRSGVLFRFRHSVCESGSWLDHHICYQRPAVQWPPEWNFALFRRLHYRAVDRWIFQRRG